MPVTTNYSMVSYPKRLGAGAVWLLDFSRNPIASLKRWIPPRQPGGSRRGGRTDELRPIPERMPRSIVQRGTFRLHEGGVRQLRTTLPRGCPSSCTRQETAGARAIPRWGRSPSEEPRQNKHADEFSRSLDLTDMGAFRG